MNDLTGSLSSDELQSLLHLLDKLLRANDVGVSTPQEK
ncbi:MAG: hypothetical protein GAK45_01657 [Pseudomonas citronellolis]|nr:MAG: hypothetical protein GAK45_01657 [Pseudomonas citronellolis]